MAGSEPALSRDLRAKLAAAFADMEAVSRLTQQAASINAETLSRLTREAIRTIEEVNRRLSSSSLMPAQQDLLRSRVREMLDYHEDLLAACRRQGIAKIEAPSLPVPPHDWGTLDEFLDGLSLGGWERFKNRDREGGVVGDFMDGLLLRPKRRR